MWAALPLELKSIIYREAQEKNLSAVDTHLKQLSARITTSLLIAPPPFHDEKGEQDILIRLIKRYNYIKSLSFGEFNENEKNHLHKFIQYLNRNPLKHIEKLVIHEIRGSGAIETKEVNRMLLGALGHPNLKSVFIHVHYEPSVLTGEEIQPLLEKSVNLRKFKLNCHSLEHPSIKLAFDKQVKLRSAHLIEFCEHLDTLQSLRSCKKLRSLRLNNAHNPTRIKEMLADIPSTSLSRLCIPGMHINSDSELDAITKAHPNLTHLQISLGKVSEKGTTTIKENCPELTTLSISGISDEQRKSLKAKFPHLKLL